MVIVPTCVVSCYHNIILLSSLRASKKEALCCLQPMLPNQLKKNHDVTVLDFSSSGTTLKFEGSPSGIEKAYQEVSDLIRTMLEKEVHITEQYQLDQLKSVRTHIKADPVYVCCSEVAPTTSVLLYSFHSDLLDKIAPVVKNLLSVSSVALECKPEETVYLKSFHKAYWNKLPVVVKFSKDDQITLSGGDDEIHSCAAKIRSDIFQGLYSRKFDFHCSSKFKSQIEEVVLLSRETEDPTFKFCLHKAPGQSGQGKGRRRPSQGPADAKEAFTVYVFSKNTEFFETVCQLLQRINPGSKYCQISHKDEERIVLDMKVSLENKYKNMLHISVNTESSSFSIHGLIADDIQKCHNEIKQKVESTLVVTKYVPVDLQLFNLLDLYKSDIEELRRDCLELTVLKPNKEHDSCLMRIKGSINQVKDIKERLSSGLLSINVSIEAFDISCPQGLFGMWCKRWNQVKAQEEKRSKVSITFRKRSDASGQKKLIVHFDIVGTDKDTVQEVMGTIVSEGVDVEEKTLSLSASATTCLLKAKREKKLDFLNETVVYVKNIDIKTNTVILCAPKELSDNLETAEEKIRKFAGERANTSHVITSNNPVVGLILSNTSKSMPYIASANMLAKPHGASVHVLKKPSVGLRISGTEVAIETVKVLVRSTVLEAIEKTIGCKQVPVKSLYTSYLSSSEFTRFQSKLESDLNVICSRPMVGKKSKEIATSLLRFTASDSYIKINICKGNLVQEQVDAIVNAANENLKHNGGLAKAILDTGGLTIQSESDEYTRIHGKVKPGAAVCLGSGNLQCKKVIHAVGPQWNGGQHNEEQLLYFSIFRSLEAAGKEALTSIAFPAISTGIFGVPVSICARSSLKAVRDYFQTSPNTTIQNVKFVLFTQDAIDAFKPLLVSGLCGQYQGDSRHAKSEIQVAPSIAAASSPHVSNWQWCNDQGSFSYYSSDVSSKLTTAYQSNPKGSFQISMRGTIYIIDFAKMVQINHTTGYSRPIVSMLSAASNIQWVYQDGSTFLPYTAENSKALESMYQSNSPRSLGIRGNTYTFDFNQMIQVNVSSGCKRQIDRRQIAASASGGNAIAAASVPKEVEEELRVADCITLTLRGPFENLAAAEAKVLSKLQGAVKSQVIGSLPKNMPSELEKKIRRIANKNTVMCSFEERLKQGQKHRVLKLEGIHFKLQTAVSAIQEEILTFHVNSESFEEEFTPPPKWVNQTKTTELFSVPQGSPEWQLVEGKFTMTMGANRVSSISRIQNTWIWKKYAFQKKRMHTKNGGRVNEKELFHGTRTNDPRNIYEGEDGFDMRYSRQGLWGVANYFAVNASYSHNYAHTSSHGKQMFLVKVLTGDSHDCPSNRDLRMPPAKTSPQSGDVQMAGAKYDTVTGNTNGSQVFMTYDNDKAYPAYLITYN